MNEYKINLDKEYILDVYTDRHDVVSQRPTIIVYLEKTDEAEVYQKTFCEFVENPKSYVHDNPPVNEALNNDIFLILKTENEVVNDSLRIYYQRTVVRFNHYFKNNKIKLPE